MAAFREAKGDNGRRGIEWRMLRWLPSMHAPLSFRSLFLLAVICPLGGCGEDSKTTTAAVISQEKAPPTKLAAPPTREPIEVDWEHLSMEFGEDNKFEPWMVPSRVQALEGKRVRVKGLIYAGSLSQRGNIREFPLIRELGCQFGNGAPAWHVIMVRSEERRVG